MNERLKQLYQSVILKHSKEPVHYEKNETASCVLDAYNPLCGDRYQLFFDIRDGMVEHMSFYGYGCAVSKASTSVLVKRLQGRPVEEALQLCREFHALLREEGASPAADNEEFAAFAAARSFPGRMKCATLSWDEMELFLEEYRARR